MTNNFPKWLAKYNEVGFTQHVWQTIVKVTGLPNVKIGEVVMFETGQLGQVMSLKKDLVEVLALTKEPIKVGIKVARTGNKLSVLVGPDMLGKTVDGLGRMIEGKVDETTAHWREVDVTPGGIAKRRIINRPMHTGVSITDLMIPIGKGQRELIVGDRKTGKSIYLLQVALSQAAAGCVCVYVAVAKKKTEVKKIEGFLKDQGVWNNCILVATSSQDSPGEIFMSPYTGMAIAEYFRDMGRDVLIIMDDMSAHAVFYRELSLVSRKFPGRDSYPGDIFHVHSKLMERAGNFDINGKDVAITCLPVAETLQGDITGYIQTNLMSMTDGHIFFDGELFFKGRRPPVNPFVSVTRVGKQTQTNITRETGATLLSILSSYEKTQEFLKFGAELGEGSRQILAMGDRILAMFDQPIDHVVPFNLQLVLVGMVLAGVWNGKNLIKILVHYENNPDLVKLIDEIVGGCENMNKLIEKTRPHSDKLIALMNT